MKNISQILIVIFSIMIFTQCDYLDIVPDETAQEKDMFANTKAAERFLYACYSYMPRANHTQQSMDFLTGDEVVTPFEHESFANFPKGNYNAEDPQLSYWKTLFGGLRYCYLLKDKVDAVPKMEEKVALDYKAQVDFLIGYYHFLLIRNYGPTILIKGVEDINSSVEDFAARTPFDECVDFAVKKFDDAAKNLPEKREGDRLGLASKVIAKACKAKLLLYAASPLFNGNSEFYADFKNKDGQALMPTTYDPNKWVKAKDAIKEAIDAAESIGHKLYYSQTGALSNIPEPVDSIQRGLRFCFIDVDNTKEVVWGDTRPEGTYDLQAKSAPYALDNKFAYNGVAPTLAMVERFYTKNGLPIDKDPEFQYDNRFDLVKFPKGGKFGEGKTIKLNLDREPRFYSWITYQGGYYEISGKQSKGIYTDAYKRGKDDGKLLMQMMIGQPQGRGADKNTLRKNNYSPTGYLNKKGVHPLKTPQKSKIKYIWPIIRLADLYLMYAEACVETNNLDEAKIYLNKVRERAGIPTVEDAWAKVPGANLDQSTLRDIVRQERMIELYLENQNFWDLRRWKIAKKYLDAQPLGMNIVESSITKWSVPTPVAVERKFYSPQNYLMPIPQEEINKNINLVQNPGY